MNLKQKIDELAEHFAGTEYILWVLESPQGQELLRWVAEQAVENAESNLNWSCDFGCGRSEFCDEWWAKFSEGL